MNLTERHWGYTVLVLPYNNLLAGDNELGLGSSSTRTI